MGTREDAQRDLNDAAEHIERMKGRSYRSSDEAIADLFLAQAKLNHALAQAATSPTNGYALLQTDIPQTIERIVGQLVDRAHEIARQFKAAQFSIQVSGFPPSVSVALTWSTT